MKPSPNVQTLDFSFPESAYPTHVRFDLGNNPQTEDVVLNKFKLSYGNKSLEAKGSDFFNYFYALIICFVFIITLCIIIYDVPYLYSSQMGFWNYHHIGSPPRFWDQGWIPMEYP